MEGIASFRKDWFNNTCWWFNKNDEYDLYITENYGYLLDIPNDTGFDILSLILIYDQLPRHIFRHQQANHVIDWFLQKALRCHSLHDVEYEENLLAIEWTFFMLPLRHTNSCSTILFVVKKTWDRLDKTKDVDEINTYKRFIKASLTRLNTNDQSGLIKIAIQHDIPYDNLLDFAPLSNVWGICQNNLQDIQPHINDINIQQPIIISLSGGVDSMVCSYLLANSRLIDKSRLIAVHINYNNRVKCDQEVSFLYDWCRYLNIPLFVRKIEEIKRASCMKFELRDLYETYTRNVRYGTYKSAVKDVQPQVVLGHNLDDRFENIMTNIAHKNKYENLNGMEVVSCQDDIVFIRPLLDVSKDDIIKFARSHNIPYLPNSTPTWSQRGQIRNSIVPILDKWDSNFTKGMFVLSDTLGSLHKMLQTSVRQFINTGITRQDDNRTIFECTLTSIEDLQDNGIFWKELIQCLFKKTPSSKSIENLVFSIGKYKLSTLRDDCKTVLVTKDIHLELIKKKQSVLVRIMKF